MDIFKRIESDHQLQRSLMSQLLETEGASDDRKVLFEQFCTEFEAHAAAEEDGFYAPLLKSEQSTDQSRHSIAEHQEAMELLDTLKDTDMSSSAWLVTFKKLAHDNEHHMDEEEKDVFPLVREVVSAEVQATMLADFDQRKDSELAT